MLTTVARLADQLAIQDLVHQYNHALDRRDEALFASLWAQAARCGPCTGVDEIVAAFRKTDAGHTDLHHLSTNLVVSVDGDRAHGWSKSMIFRGKPDAPADPSVPLYVSYRDEYRRVDGEWKFTLREFTAH